MKSGAATPAPNRPPARRENCRREVIEGFLMIGNLVSDSTQVLPMGNAEARLAQMDGATGGEAAAGETSGHPSFEAWVARSGPPARHVRDRRDRGVEITTDRGLPPPRTLHDSVVPGTDELSRLGKAIAPMAHDSAAAAGNQRG